MSDWIHNLPIPSMTLVIFGFTYLLAAGIFAGVSALATEGRAQSFKVISPGMLPVLGILFGLFVAFTAAQVWADNDHASAAVSREASALRAVTLLAAGLPAEQEARLVASGAQLCRAGRNGGMADDGPPDGVAAGRTRAARRGVAGGGRDDADRAPVQQAAQREIITALGSALDARRQRIIVSQAEVNPVKWWCLYLQAVCELIAIALVHCDNRLASAIALGLFATGVATSVSADRRA